MIAAAATAKELSSGEMLSGVGNNVGDKRTRFRLRGCGCGRIYD